MAPSANAEVRHSYLAPGATPFWQRFPAPEAARAMSLNGATLLLAYEDCRAAFADRRLVQANLALLEAEPGIDPRFIARRRHAILDMEGEAHVRLRRLVMRAFSPSACEAYRTIMRGEINDRLDALAGASVFDAADAICRPYPGAVISKILGVPPADIDFFIGCAEAWTRWIREGLDAVPAAIAAHAEMDRYLLALVEARADAPQPDLISALLSAEEDGDKLSHMEIVWLVAGLVVAGVDTTRNALANALYLFCDHPQDWARLRADPATIAPAIEEVLRFAPVAPLMRRVASEALDLNGLAIAQGQHVLISIGSANRSATHFPDPHRFDAARAPSFPHLTFAAGRKHCLGAHLARMELHEALARLSQAWPNLAREGETQWHDAFAFQGPSALILRVN